MTGVFWLSPKLDRYQTVKYGMTAYHYLDLHLAHTASASCDLLDYRSHAYVGESMVRAATRSP